MEYGKFYLEGEGKLELHPMTICFEARTIPLSPPGVAENHGAAETHGFNEGQAPEGDAAKGKDAVVDDALNSGLPQNLGGEGGGIALLGNAVEDGGEADVGATPLPLRHLGKAVTTAAHTALPSRWGKRVAAVEVHTLQTVLGGEVEMVVHHQPGMKVGGDGTDEGLELGEGGGGLAQMHGRGDALAEESLDAPGLAFDKFGEGEDDDFHGGACVRALRSVFPASGPGTEEVERGIPVLPHGLPAEFRQAAADFGRTASVAHRELLQGLGIGVVSSGIDAALGRHGGDAEGGHMVADKGGLAGGIGDVDVVVKDAHGKGGLRQLAVGHDAVGAEAFVLRRTHTGEVDGIARPPVVLLQIAQMAGHHHHVGAPIAFQTDEHTHADGVHSGLPHTVEGIAAPFEDALHAAGMIVLVVRTVIGFLKADYAVHAMVAEGTVVVGLEGHHLDFDVREIRLGNVDGGGQIFHPSLCRILAGDEKNVLEGSQALDGAVLVLNLLRGEDNALHGVFAVKTTVDAGVAAGIGEI